MISFFFFFLFFGGKTCESIAGSNHKQPMLPSVKLDKPDLTSEGFVNVAGNK